MQNEDEISLRDLVYFPLFFNIIALGATGLSFMLLPGLMADYGQMMFVIYLTVFLTELLLAYVLIRRTRNTDMSIRTLLTPLKKLRWLPAIGVFIALNALFITYIGIILWTGYVTSFTGLSPVQILFFIVLAPLAAGIVEELAFRGYLIEIMVKKGLAENRIVVYSALSFAFIHGFFIIDKLIMTFVFGLIAGFYYVRERNLPVLIIAHVVVDVVTFGMSVYGF
jgi:membrane protease YdiL (CAAX protease family)